MFWLGLLTGAILTIAGGAAFVWHSVRFAQARETIERLYLGREAFDFHGDQITGGPNHG